MIKSLLLAGSAFKFFLGALGSEGINLRLTVGGFLLHLTELLCLEFLLLLDSTLFSSNFCLTTGLILVVTDDLHLLLFLFVLLLLLSLEGFGVGSLDFLNRLSHSQLLILLDTSVLLLHFLNAEFHLLGLFFKDLPFFDSVLLSFLNLIDNDPCALVGGLDTFLLPLLSGLKTLQSFNFHHDVKSLLLADPVALELFRLLQLLVTDRNDLGI